MGASDNDMSRRFTVSSNDLPSNADERARRRYLEEIVSDSAGGVELELETPGVWSHEVVAFGSVVLGRLEGTIVRGTRSLRHIAADSHDNFFIVANPRSPALVRQGRREIVQPPSSTTLLSFAEPLEIRAGAVHGWLGVHIPRAALCNRVWNADDLAASKLRPDTPAMRHFRRYLRFVFSPKGVPVGDPHLDEQVATTLTDLTALALGARGDEAELARLRGVRAARLALAMEELQRGFSDPKFSVHTVAARLFVSPRTLQDLLYEAGASFTERVLELRLQKARQMLASPEQREVQVARIAYACGFRDVSYFNRCFRRRFGASPRELRA